MSDLIGDTAGSPNLGISDSATVGCPSPGSLPSISFGVAGSGSQPLTEGRPLMSLRATWYNRTSLALQLPRRVIPEHDRDDILETRLAGPDETDNCSDVRVGGNTSIPHENVSMDEEKIPRKERDEEIDRHYMVRKASKYMDSLALLIPESAIPKHDRRDDIFDVTISRESKPKEGFHVFMTHLPGYDRAYLNIRHVGAKEGEEFRVWSVEKLEPKGFAEKYNTSKPEGLENTHLSRKEGKFMMKVDNVEFELKDCVLRAQEGKAVLDAKLNDEGKNTVKIAFGIDGMDFRFTMDHAAVTSIREGREGVVATYMRTQDDIPPHKRLIELPHQEPRELEEWKHEVKLDSEGLLVSRRLECERGKSTIELSEDNRMKAANYYASTELPGEKRWHQADIGEEVAGLALEKSGFRTISEHTEPLDDRTPQHKSEEHGMDRVVEREGKYYVVSVKHWLQPEKALKNAREDLEKYAETPEKDELERDLKIKLEGGIAVEVFWSYRDLEVVIYTDYVEY